MFPYLTTERLQLRPLSIDDAQEIYLLRSDEKHNEFIDRPRATSLDDAKAFINKIEKLLSEGTSHFWVVSFNDGLHKLDRKSGKFTTIHSIRNNRDTAFHFPSNCIAEDLNKRLWIGTDNGLKYYDLKSKTFSRFEDLHRDTNQLSSDLIVSLYCDSEGILWIAGTNGVTLFNTKTG